MAAMHWGQDGVHGHFFGQSSFATYSLATERNVVKIPREVPLELMGPLGCGMQTGAGAVFQHPGSSSGREHRHLRNRRRRDGGHHGGAHCPEPARSSPLTSATKRLALAAELGATHTINGRNEDIRSRIMAITGSGVDYVLEITAQPKNAKARSGCA
jgi:aryl-alcohol dehydrogenase